MKKIFTWASGFIGWKTNKKIVVIESDDWGAIRIPNKDVRDAFIKEGIGLNKNIFTNLDCLDSDIDISRLSETLASCPRDNKGNYPKFTMLALTHNPNFDAMHKQPLGNLQYVSETVNQSYDKHSYTSLEEIRKGVNANLFFPELHGREHLNVRFWIEALNSKKFATTTRAFENGFFGIHPEIAGEERPDFQAAFDVNSSMDIKRQKVILLEAMDKFSSIYGVSPKYFVPPNGPYNDSLDEVLQKRGIKYILNPKNRIMPTPNGGKRKIHYLGQVKKSGLIILGRNVIFEPSRGREKEVASALLSIEQAFSLNKPAVIGTHRVNYVGGIENDNRDFGNIQLQILLTKIIEKWPEVEFLSSVELGNLIQGDRRKN